jgi:hypothetical protein
MVKNQATYGDTLDFLFPRHLLTLRVKILLIGHPRELLIFCRKFLLAISPDCCGLHVFIDERHVLAEVFCKHTYQL